VLEFSAEEGRCYVPYWMMRNLDLSEGVIINVKNTSLSKATFVKFKPQSVDFLEISNPRVVLERALRKFTCLTVGDIIQINHSGLTYQLKVIELKPQPAVSIVETDCEVDFEEPEGYKESKYYKAEMEHRERALSRLSEGDAPRAVQKAKVEPADGSAESKPTFEAFSGNARRIDGKQLKQDDASSSASASATAGSNGNSAKQAAAAAAVARAASTSTATSSAKPPVAPTYQSKIGDKYSKIKTSSSAFTGAARKLT
jgi:ubiquitin fusion degradation protein 1